MPTEVTPTDTATVDAMERELAGLDALELSAGDRRSRAARMWSAAWPKLGALAFVLLFWQCVVWSHWKKAFVLPGPGPVLGEFWHELATGKYTDHTLLPATAERALIGFAIAVLLGTAIGAVMSQVKVIRTAFSSLITGLQTMPSVVWLPMALVLFGLNEKAVAFVVVMGAFPSVANGVLSGADQVPPILLRAGRVLGAKRYTLWREVVLPASLPSFVSGLKQGWAFSWRSLMAAELIAGSNGNPGIGGLLDNQRSQIDYVGMYATMILILVIGLVVDSAFTAGEKAINRRRGLVDAAA